MIETDCCTLLNLVNIPLLCILINFLVCLVHDWIVFAYYVYVRDCFSLAEWIPCYSPIYFIEVKDYRRYNNIHIRNYEIENQNLWYYLWWNGNLRGAYRSGAGIDVGRPFARIFVFSGRPLWVCLSFIIIITSTTATTTTSASSCFFKNKHWHIANEVLKFWIKMYT